MQLTPEQINEFISKSVLESQIGEAVKAAVKKQIDNLSKSYDNPFDVVIRNIVTEQIHEIVTAQYKDQLRDRVERAIAAAMTEEMFDRIVSSALDRFKQNSSY